MLILGIDTSGRQGSVALLQAPEEAPGGPLRTVELALLSGGQYSELLVPAIAGLLERHGVEKRSVGLLAVASGPGSFTGLRVAIATVKGLAEAFGVPVAPVSVLEAILLASAAEGRPERKPGRDQGRAVAALDAQRGEVFWGEFADGHLREEIAGCEEFAAALGGGSPLPAVFTPDAALAARLGDAALKVELVVRPSAEDIARIGYGKFLDGVRADVASLDANYVRRSDAEIFSAPRLGIGPGSR